MTPPVGDVTSWAVYVSNANIRFSTKLALVDTTGTYRLNLGFRDGEEADCSIAATMFLDQHISAAPVSYGLYGTY